MRIQPFKPFPHHREGLDIHRYIYRAGRDRHPCDAGICAGPGRGTGAGAVTGPGGARPGSATARWAGTAILRKWLDGSLRHHIGELVMKCEKSPQKLTRLLAVRQFAELFLHIRDFSDEGPHCQHLVHANEGSQPAAIFAFANPFSPGQMLWISS
jgi:hypothetical protein